MSCREASKRRLQPGSGCCKQRPRLQLKSAPQSTYCPTPSWAAPAPRGRPWAPGVGRLPAARAGHARVSTSIRQEHRRPRTAAELELGWPGAGAFLLCAGRPWRLARPQVGPPPIPPMSIGTHTSCSRGAHAAQERARARGAPPAPRPGPRQFRRTAQPTRLHGRLFGRVAQRHVWGPAATCLTVRVGQVGDIGGTVRG